MNNMLAYTIFNTSSDELQYPNKGIAILRQTRCKLVTSFVLFFNIYHAPRIDVAPGRGYLLITEQKTEVAQMFLSTASLNKP